MENVTGDISTGSNNTWWYLIAANLSTNDPICNESVYRINETITMTILGVSRLVNHLAYNDSSAPGEYWHGDYYWDKETGLVVEIYQDSNATGSHWTGTLSLASTTVFPTSLNPIPLWVFLAVGIVIAAVVLTSSVVLIRARRRTQ
jgi:hypothetical protein